MSKLPVHNIEAEVEIYIGVKSACVVYLSEKSLIDENPIDIIKEDIKDVEDDRDWAEYAGINTETPGLYVVRLNALHRYEDESPDYEVVSMEPRTTKEESRIVELYQQNQELISASRELIKALRVHHGITLDHIIGANTRKALQNLTDILEPSSNDDSPAAYLRNISQQD
jgi:murein L,D-transpeptidase YcbB/YkuD